MNLIKVAFGMLLVALCIMLGSVRQLDDYVLDSVSEPESNDTPDEVMYVDNTILNSKGAILEFLNSGNFTYSESRNDIPKLVLDSIFRFHEDDDKFCDKNTRDSFSIGCTRLLPLMPYRKLLKFVAYNDSNCLISYVEGGFVSFRMVEFFEYKGDVKRTAFNINECELGDILKLKTYLTEFPNITKLKLRPYSDSSIYIKDSNVYSNNFIEDFKDYFSAYDTVALIQDSLIINSDIENFIKIPTDLPLNKKVTYKAIKGKSTYTLDLTRINFSTIKYTYQKVNQGKIQYTTRGEADLQPSFYLGTQGIFNDAKSNVYGMNEYINPKAKKQEITIYIGVGSIEKSFIKFRNKTGKVVSSPELTIQQ